MVDTVLSVHFRDMDVDELLRNKVEVRCRNLSEEFPEITHVEVTLSPDGEGHAATGHVTGRRTDVATHAAGDEPAHAAAQLLGKLRQQLRRTRDKRIAERRRDAQRSHPRRQGAGL